MLLLVHLDVLVHLFYYAHGDFLVGAGVRIEKLIGLLGAEEEYPVFKVLLLELCHLLVHDESLGKVLELTLAFALDFGIDLDKNFEISRHHVGQRIAAGLNLLQRIINVLDLLLPLELSLLRLQLVQFLKQGFDLCNPLLAQLPNVRTLFEQRQEVTPNDV